MTCFNFLFFQQRERSAKRNAPAVLEYKAANGARRPTGVLLARTISVVLSAAFAVNFPALFTVQKRISFIFSSDSSFFFEVRTVCPPLTAYAFNDIIRSVLRFCGRSTDTDRGVCFCAFLYSPAIQGGPKHSAKAWEKQYTVYCTMDRSTENI